MLRRKFIFLLTGGVVAAASRLYGDHYLVSKNPLLVDFDLQSLTGQYTPAKDFYVRNHYGTPQISNTGAVEIDGEVKTPRKLRMEDFARLQQHQLGAVLECAGDGVEPAAMVSNGFWEGWALSDVLSLSGPLRTATYLHLIGGDGFVRSVPFARARAGGFLVTRLNHQPLAREHGAPWRVLFPGCYGMDSVKWVQRLTVSSTPTPLQAAGDEYMRVLREPSGKVIISALPPIQIKSAIVHPPVGAVLRCGNVEVRGVAWTGVGKVACIYVTADKGRSWVQAKLGVQNQWEWVQWQAKLKLLEPGLLQLGCRATDDRGNEQPIARDPKRLDGYGDNTVEFMRCLLVRSSTSAEGVFH